ncbi:DMT family transporter [Salinispirillum sp. LH 10-3-1]|uniref:DMT family transporter n=1 Tax=Salinispirillum sp. LH 10-3-1 TaxID=2952525 RepID=A0AB38YFG7_9GAMM
MSGRTLGSAILLLVLGNALAVLSDALIKWQGSDMPIFQFIFIRMAFSLCLLLPFVYQIDRTRLFAGWKLHLVRSHMGFFGIYCMIIALTTLPLATANALFYVAPILVMVFSVIIFGEKLRGISLFAVISGLLGIVVILRPVELTWGALSALGVALSLALTVVLIRKLPTHQSMVHTLVLTKVFGLPTALALALWEGAAWDPQILMTAFGSAFFILAYNMTVLLAYRHVPASEVTSAEYTGLLSAMLFGWLWFQEIPDAWFIVGSVMIVGPLVMISLLERRRTRVPIRTAGVTP